MVLRWSTTKHMVPLVKYKCINKIYYTLDKIYRVVATPLWLSPISAVEHEWLDFASWGKWRCYQVEHEKAMCTAQVVLKCLSHTPSSHPVCTIRTSLGVDLIQWWSCDWFSIQGWSWNWFDPGTVLGLIWSSDSPIDLIQGQSWDWFSIQGQSWDWFDPVTVLLIWSRDSPGIDLIQGRFWDWFDPGTVLLIWSSDGPEIDSIKWQSWDWFDPGTVLGLIQSRDGPGINLIQWRSWDWFDPFFFRPKTSLS